MKKIVSSINLKIPNSLKFLIIHPREQTSIYAPKFLFLNTYRLSSIPILLEWTRRAPSIEFRDA